MAKVTKKTVNIAVKPVVKGRSESITVYASPSWQLKRIGTVVMLTSPSGFFPIKKDGLVQIKITVEE